jgi:DNA-binding NarL/FixJ family response regulator
MGKSIKCTNYCKGAHTRMIADNRVVILILSDPGKLRDSIFTILASMPNVMLVDSPSADRYSLNIIKQLQPDIILIDSDIYRNFTDLIRDIKIADDGIRCVVISEKINTSKLTLKDGADYVLLKGFTRRELYRIIQEVLLKKQTLSNLTGALVLDPTQVFQTNGKSKT